MRTDNLKLVGTNATRTSGGVFQAGTSASKISCSTANMKFMECRFQCDASSGDNRAMYLRLYFATAGAGGEALRAFTTVQDVAAGTCHGAHISLNFGTSGTVTGQGIAARCTLHIPSTALSSNVTMAAIQAEIWSDTATSDPGGSTKLSYIRFVNGGNTTGDDDVDDDAWLFDLQGMELGSGHTIGADTAGATTLDFTHWVPIKIMIGTTVHYMVAAQTIAATGG